MHKIMNCYCSDAARTKSERRAVRTGPDAGLANKAEARKRTWQRWYEADPHDA